jgi:hypothetical protein
MCVVQTAQTTTRRRRATTTRDDEIFLLGRRDVIFVKMKLHHLYWRIIMTFDGTPSLSFQAKYLYSIHLFYYPYSLIFIHR